MGHSRLDILTLYADYIRYRGGEISTSSLIRLLDRLGVSEQAARSSLSRMWKRGWLSRRRIGRRSHYSATEKSQRLFAATDRRIFEPRDNNWDGSWYLVAYSMVVEKRHERNRLRRELRRLGCGMLNMGVWLSPNDDTAGVLEVCRRLGVTEYVQVFRGRDMGFSGGRELAARCWDLGEINRQYAAFIEQQRYLLSRDKQSWEKGPKVDPGEFFDRRFRLLDQYRELSYVDPGLPPELLPPGWLGAEAQELFNEYYALLSPKANEFVDSVLEGAPI